MIPTFTEVEYSDGIPIIPSEEKKTQPNVIKIPAIILIPNFIHLIYAPNKLI